MKHPCALEADQLFRRCNPDTLGFENTSELPDVEDVVGQTRASHAAQFGIGIKQKGYNIFTTGQPGSGRRSLITQVVNEVAGSDPVPDDWCYVYNFKTPQKPNAFSLPAGTAQRLREDMEHLMEELAVAIPAAYESEEYRVRRKQIEEEYKHRQESALDDIKHRAEENNIALLPAPGGFAFAVLRDGKTIPVEEYEKLPREEQEAIQGLIESYEHELEKLGQQTVRWRREMREKFRELNQTVISSTVRQIIVETKKPYHELSQVMEYLDDVEQDVIAHGDAFARREAMAGGAGEMDLGETLRRYQVNVFVDNADTKGAPIVYLDHPTYPNLVGRVEHQAQMGTLVTDFTLIRSGALHQANGGYLLINAYQLLTQPYAWEGLKRALRTGVIEIESLAQMLSLISTVSLEPESIPLNIKIVLLGERKIYYLLCEYDPEFGHLFKVVADFEDEIDRQEEQMHSYARVLATLARRESLKVLDKYAVAAVLDHGSRLVEDGEKLTTRFGHIMDVVREADYWAAQRSADIIGAEDIERAITTRRYHHSRIAERLREEVRRGVLLIATEGERVGQVNGLSVFEVGGVAHGHPSRITATVHHGKGEVVDIEREIELGGPIHSKGVLILSGFLCGRYAREKGLSLSASLSFEQTYGGIEGDSASSTELYALLSAIGKLPIKQSIAVTGSVNQMGDVQAIGGVNEKVEGFFKVCEEHGLNGEQGVIVPVSNIPHLMLHKEVVDAVARGQFHIYAVSNIDQGMEILTGMVSGELDENGEYPEDSINGRIAAELKQLARHADEEDEEESDQDSKSR